jgi:hypothetical protein
MNEREILTKSIAWLTIEYLKKLPMFQLLVLFDAEKENTDLLAPKGTTKLPEHIEQLAIDGVSVSVNAIRDVIKEMEEVFSNENVERCVTQTIKDYKEAAK